MGTRSDIIVHRTDGKWHRIYCHWDGYLSHNGKILFENYNSQKKAESLVKLGDLSSLGEKIGVKHPFEAPDRWLPEGKGVGFMEKKNPAFEEYKAKYEGMCLAYGRDRGEKDVGGTVADTLAGCWPENDTWTEFTYVWDEGKWWVGDPDEGTQTLIELGDALAGKKTLKPAIKAFGMVLGHHAAHVPGGK